jgi:hypothetical protein
MNASRTGSREARTGKKNPPGDPRGARSSAAVRRALRGESVSHDPLLSFTRTNYLFMAAGAVLAIAGFMLLRGGDISLAPLLLVVGYCVLFPLGIIWRDRAPSDAPAEGRGPKSGE